MIFKRFLISAASFLWVCGSTSAQDTNYVAPLWQNPLPDLGLIPPVLTESDAATLTGGDEEPPLEGFSLLSIVESVEAEIASLAEALGNDPVRIFNYVRNNIDYEQYTGLRKGPELTLLEGSGNDVDTCSLLAELLKAAGHTNFHYRYQVRRISMVDMTDWLGLAEEPWPGKTFLEALGIPNPTDVGDLDAKRVFNAYLFLLHRHAEVAGRWPGDDLSSGLSRVWLHLTYQGVGYHLDPSFKRYERISGVDLKAAMGYNIVGKDRAALLTTAGGTPGDGFISALNNTNLGTFLNNRTQDLLGSLATQFPGWTVEEITKGRRIIKEDVESLGDAFPLPNAVGDYLGGIATWTVTPESLKSKVTFSTGSLNYPIATADLKGRKIALAASGNEVQLWLDDTKVATRPSVTESSYSFTIELTHPLDTNIMRETKVYKKGNDYVYAIVYGFNASGRLLQMRHEELQRHLLADANGTGRAARSEILNVMGLSWLYQTRLVNDLLASQNDIIPVNYHRFGRMAQEEGFYVDVGVQYSRSYAANGETDDRYDNLFHLGSMFASALEHGIIEQLQPGSSAVSTVNILRRANEIGNKRIYRIDPALVQSGTPWNNAKAALASYANINTKNGVYDYGLEPFSDTNSNGQWDPGEPFTDSTELEQFEFFANIGGITILPQKRAVTQSGWDWSGSGWVLRHPGLAGMIINGGYSGGYSTNWGWVAPAPVTSWGYTNPSYTYAPPSYTTSSYIAPSYSTPKFFGSDPVDMATGAFTFANTDMETGLEGAPRGLSFSRQYSSNSRQRNDQRIGYGWTHSLHIEANDRTATEEALGLGNPRQTAPFLVAMIIASDLNRRDATVKEHALASLVTGWYVDRLTNNAVSVTIGDQTYQFLRNPDGSFESPTGSTMTLSQVGSGSSRTYRLKQRNCNEFVFERSAGNSDGSKQRIKQIVDPDGRTMSFVYLGGTPENRINYVQDAVSRRFTFRYDGSNRIDRITDSIDSRFIGFTYDGSGNLITHTDPEGKNFHYDYTIPAGQNPPDPSGTAASEHRIVRLRNHDNQIITQNVFDDLGRVYEQYHHGNTAMTWKLKYTGFANTEEDPEGGITTYFYDERGRATGKRDPEGNTESWLYDGQDRIVEKTTGSGETTVYHFDNQHNIFQIDHPRGGGSTHMVYDSLGRIDLVTDPDNHQTDYVYNVGNTKDRPNQIIDPGGTTTFLYKTSGAAIGRVSRTTDHQGLFTEQEYNALGHPLWTKAPGGFQTTYNYSTRGDLMDVTDSNTIKVAYLYNNRRQVTKITSDPGGASQSVEDYIYNNQGLLERKTEAADNGGQRFATRYEYSPTEKLRFTRTSDNDGEGANDPVTEIRYDGRDWQREMYDPADRLTSFDPLANGQPWKTTLPLSRLKTQVQDGDGRPVSGTVPGSAGTRSSGMVYDVAPSGYPRTTTTTADNLTASEIQNRTGKTRWYTNRKENVWEFRYDGLGRRTHFITPLDSANSRSHLTEYHHRGVVKKVTEPSGQVTDFIYHPTNGRLTSVSDGVGTISHTSYDNNGKLLNTSETRTGVAGAKTTNRTYERQGRLASRTDENGQTIGYRYYSSGKVWKIIYPGGTENGVGHVEYTWWQSGQLKQVIDKLDSTTVPRVTSYEWLKDGRLKKVTRPNNTVREIKYDAAGRPDVIEEYGPGMKLIFVHKHGYFPSDEMQWRYTLPSKRTSGTDPPAMLAMTFNSDNQLATWGGMSVTHDPDGNMTSGPAPFGGSLTSYTYDTRNRLTGALGTSYVYDADGQRVGKSKTGETTTFAVDVGSELSKVLVRTKNGVPTRYVWGLGLLYEVNGSGGSATTVSYHHDATGSTIALTDDSATVIERIGYTPWGQINHRANLAGTLHDTPFLFTGFFGNQTDDNGLLYMRNRYYHPLIGRFLNADPAQEGMNWYGYGGGNPIGMVDPMGLGITSALNAVQSTLSFLGMIPVFGAVFDVVNAGISIGRGNYLDAGFNLASAIPGIGDFAAGAKLIGAGAAAYGGFKGVSYVSNNYSVGSRLFSGIPSFTPRANNTVYQSFNPGTTITNYVGITNNFARRSVEHFNSARNLTITPIQGLSNLTRYDARAAEQVLINYHGISKSGGGLLNLINSIAPNNPIYRTALTRGEQLLKNAGYPGF
jgi:RHS repeat-associated protein